MKSTNRWEIEMGKRYKRGNHKRKKEKSSDVFYQREKVLNRKINDFKNSFYHLEHPPTLDEYIIMNKKRMDIKTLLDVQGNIVSRQSRRRRTFYYWQLEKFKRIYTKWKRYTYYIFLTHVYNVPMHLHTSLKWFNDSSKKNFFVMKNGNL